jgi:diguanylate cyclase (GGDEF)-like protein
MQTTSSAPIPDRRPQSAIAPEDDERPIGRIVDVPRDDATNGLTTSAMKLRKAINVLAWFRLLFADNRAGPTHVQRRIQALEIENCRLRVALAELVHKEAESSYLAYHDSLTALPNRRLLIDRFRQASFHADRHQEQVALLFIDLDRFKRVNDNCGHVFGDKVLQMVATRIQKAIRATDTACRYGGDEFVVMLPEIASAAIAVDLADKIRHHLGQRYVIDALVIDLNASVGFAVYPRDGHVLEMLVGHAGAAMQRVKHKRRDVLVGGGGFPVNGHLGNRAAASVADS